MKMILIVETRETKDTIYNTICDWCFVVEYNHNEALYLIEECRSDIIPMREYAKMHKLDTKQRTVFQVICCSFMLDCIEKISLF